MNAAGEQHVNLSAFGLRQIARDEGVHHPPPQHEAREWTDMAAAFASLEDEVPRPLFQELREQGRRGHMEVGADPRLL